MEGVFSVGLSGTVYKIETDLHFESNQLQNNYYHIINVRLRGLMSTQDLQKRVHAFITSKLDYCRSPKKTSKAPTAWSECGC